MSEATVTPEFPRRFRRDSLPLDGQAVSVQADEAERSALARRFDLRSLDALSADLVLRPVAGGMVEATGRLRASVCQSCVVTLEPVVSQIDEDVRFLFATHDRSEASADLEFEVEEDGPTDPMVDGVFDIGEAIAQQFALALDPYPRAEGAQMTELSEEFGRGEDERDRRDSPFAVLSEFEPKRSG